MGQVNATRFLSGFCASVRQLLLRQRQIRRNNQLIAEHSYLWLMTIACIYTKCVHKWKNCVFVNEIRVQEICTTSSRIWAMGIQLMWPTHQITMWRTQEAAFIYWHMHFEWNFNETERKKNFQFEVYECASLVGITNVSLIFFSLQILVFLC